MSCLYFYVELTFRRIGYLDAGRLPNLVLGGITECLTGPLSIIKELLFLT